MISDIERAILTRQTAIFIDADYEEIQIAPRAERQDDGAGGWIDVPGAPLPSLRVRLIPQSDKVPENAGLEGRRPAPEFVLLALPDADVRRYDTFEWRGNIWQISHVHEKPEYELKADVILHAG